MKRDRASSQTSVNDASMETGGSSTPENPSDFVCLPMYGEHKRAVSAVRFAPSKLTKNQSALCASSSADGTVKIWDLGDPFTHIGARGTKGGYPFFAVADDDVDRTFPWDQRRLLVE